MNIYSRFAEVAGRVPDALAVVDGEEMVSYAELAARAGQVTEALRTAGVTEGMLVGLRAARGVEFVVGMLGIWGAGRAYVPIDPTYPEDRQDYIVADARLSHVVSVDADGDADVTAMETTAAPHDVPPDTAYVIYTSGSTGAPKGVVVGHDHVLALVDSWYAVTDFNDEDVFTWFHSGSFDFSLQEVLPPLLCGGQVVVVPAEATWDMAALADLIAVEQVTVLGLVPTVFAHLVGAMLDRPRRLPDLRYVVLSGEALDLEVIRRWWSSDLAPGATIVNDYGPTETTVSATTTIIRPDEEAPANATPIGAPLPHLGVTVVDEDLEPVGPGTPGELLITGDSLAYGYLGRPDLTAQRFVDTRWGRAYRSGDYGFRGDDGALYFIGRKDRQVQLHGFRVELGEPEEVIRKHPEVFQASVGLTGEQGGPQVLTAAYVPEPGSALSPNELAAYLVARLPRHLVPVKIKRYDRLPVTANGKMDLSAL